MKQILTTSCFFCIILLSFVTDWYEPLCIALISLLLLLILYKIGRGIVLLEVTAFLYVFTCLIMPLLGYEVYTYNNPLAKLWVRYMPVNKDIYFAYVLPAISCFCLAVTLPTFKTQLPDEGPGIAKRLSVIRLTLVNNGNKGLYIIIAGVLISYITNFLPESLNYIAMLIFVGSFAGLLYVYFSPSFAHKNIVLLVFVIFIMANALQSGMFTIVAYMGITIFSFFQVGKKISMIKKILILLVGVSFFIVLQNVKIVYRKNTWGKEYQGNKAELFTSLIGDNLQKGEALLSETAFFPLYSRTNQGYNVALVMRRMPNVKPYDGGTRLVTVFASAFVPRFLWTDKPEAGGKFNMKYYAGWNIIGWSTNVGPLGEAYGSFGPTGGIIYMFLLGLFFRGAYLWVFKRSAKIPLLICWLPVLFYDITSSSETDTLQILNSIIKSAFFIWLLTKLLPGWFGIVKNEITNRRTIKDKNFVAR
jgi:hypothetical protein